MNERIKELAEQAGIPFVRVISGSPPADLICTEQALEEFARLIVKECSDVIMTKDRYRREYFASVVNNHFKSNLNPLDN